MREAEFKLLRTKLKPVPVIAWRVDFPKRQIEHPLVDHVYLALDSTFPLSEPRVIAPQAIQREAPHWPHVERSGALCLTTTKFSASGGARVLTMLQHALDVLNMDADKRACEFRREFMSYWSQEVVSGADRGYALLDPRPDDRDIWFYRYRSGQVVFADDHDDLAQWVKNADAGTLAVKTFPKTRLIWPVAIPSPDQYPSTGLDIMELAGREHVEPHLRSGYSLPVALGFMIDGVPVYAGAVINGAPKVFLARGFRPSHPRPARLIADTYLAKPIAFMSVERVDAKWIHGRDANSSLGRLSAASVAIVGCGAIGGYLARGLAQAGVGSLTLIDPDRLKAGNVGRHVLGSEWVGKLKVEALAAQIRRDFPHIAGVESHPRAFQDLRSDVLIKLAGCDVLLLAGVDLHAELAVDQWVEALDRPPARVWTWTEEFALAGHAVVLVGSDRIGEALDDDGLYRWPLTEGWQSGEALVREAGCGASFQPYDAVDMLNTVVMAQRLVIDVLLGKVSQSKVQIWLGNRDAVQALGGEPTATFNRSYCEVSEAWGR